LSFENSGEPRSQDDYDSDASFINFRSSFSVDFDGSLYVFNTDIKIIKTTGFVNSLAGNTSPFGTLDGKGSAAHSTLQSV
jgi:hypothetical protein